LGVGCSTPLSLSLSVYQGRAKWPLRQQPSRNGRFPAPSFKSACVRACSVRACMQCCCDPRHEGKYERHDDRKDYGWWASPSRSEREGEGEGERGLGGRTHAHGHVIASNLYIHTTGRDRRCSRRGGGGVGPPRSHHPPYPRREMGVRGAGCSCLSCP
jgi:hypothetical protein